MMWMPYLTLAVEPPRIRSAPESPWLNPEFVKSYAGWREESRAVQGAYECWAGAEPRERALAWHAYQAALDREERAAHAYRACAERIAGAS
jgi:hypothetical protein